MLFKSSMIQSGPRPTVKECSLLLLLSLDERRLGAEPMAMAALAGLGVGGSVLTLKASWTRPYHGLLFLMYYSFLHSSQRCHETRCFKKVSSSCCLWINFAIFFRKLDSRPVAITAETSHFLPGVEAWAKKCAFFFSGFLGKLELTLLTFRLSLAYSSFAAASSKLAPKTAQ